MKRITAGSLATLSLIVSGALSFGAARAQGARPMAAQPASPALAPDIAAKVEQHNRQLHDQLRITPQQQPQWDRFAAVTSSNAADIG